jgi:hypothetical protein
MRRVMTLRTRPQMAQTGMVGDVEDRVKALGRSLQRNRAGVDRDLEELRGLLPELRASNPRKYKVRVLDRLLDGALDPGTISRWTSEAVGATRKQKQHESAA